MSDLPPDLPRLRTLETWLALSLDRVRQQITTLEQQAAEHAARRDPAPPSDWELETDLGRRPLRVHVGGCTMGGTGVRTHPISRDTALRALGVDRVEPCPYCVPDRELGVLD